jgi:two-component system, cell cycle response regulator
MSMNKIFQKLESSGKLPTPPGVVLRLLEITRRPDASAAEIADVIGSDPNLTSKIMRFVNSPMAGVGREVTSLHHAVALLGIRSIKMIALSFSILSQNSRGACAGFNPTRYGIQALACGLAAKHLAQQAKTATGQDAYLAGLLSQIGRPALAMSLPVEYAKVLQAASRVPRDLPKYETAGLGVTYCGVGGHLLRSWGLPETLCQAVERFRDADIPGVALPALAAILFVAERAADVLIGDDKTDTGEVARFVTAAGIYLDLTDEQAASVLREASRELHEAKSMYELSASTRSVEDIETEVRERITELGLAMHMENQTLVHRQEELLRRATTDALTGVGNRAAFDARLTLELERSARDGSTVGLLMIDVDQFKNFNDRCGHLAGDRVLQMVARIFDDNIRKVDYVARYGGEEFVVVTPASHLEGLAMLADRLRLAVEAAPLHWEGNVLKVTVSIGAAVTNSIVGVSEAAMALIGEADENMYAAKNAGRNRIFTSQTPRKKFSKTCAGAASS